MFEKDYFMRLIQTLLEGIQRIINNIDKEDINEAKQQLNDCYGLLGKDASFFMESSISDIILFFKTKEGDSLKMLEILAEMFFLEAQTETSLTLKKKHLNKSKSLFDYNREHSKEYSFEINNRLEQIKNELK